VTSGDKLKSPGVLGISSEGKEGTLLTDKGPEHNNKQFSLQLSSHIVRYESCLQSEYSKQCIKGNTLELPSVFWHFCMPVDITLSSNP